MLIVKIPVSQHHLEIVEAVQHRPQELGQIVDIPAPQSKNNLANITQRAPHQCDSRTSMPQLKETIAESTQPVPHVRCLNRHAHPTVPFPSPENTVAIENVIRPVPHDADHEEIVEAIQLVLPDEGVSGTDSASDEPALLEKDYATMLEATGGGRAGEDFGSSRGVHCASGTQGLTLREVVAFSRCEPVDSPSHIVTRTYSASLPNTTHTDTRTQNTQDTGLCEFRIVHCV